MLPLQAADFDARLAKREVNGLKGVGSWDDMLHREIRLHPKTEREFVVYSLKYIDLFTQKERRPNTLKFSLMIGYAHEKDLTSAQTSRFVCVLLAQ